MSRNTKTVNLIIDGENDEEITLNVVVKELTVKQVRRLIGSAISKKKEDKQNENPEDETDVAEKPEADDNPIGSNILDIFGDEFREIFDISIKGLEWEQVEDLSPSQLKELYDAFQQVNKLFFEIAQKLGIPDALKELLGSLKEDYLKVFASL